MTKRLTDELYEALRRGERRIDLVRALEWATAVALSLASMVEWTKVRRELERKRGLQRPLYMAASGTAAIALGWMASEAASGDWLDRSDFA